MNRTDLLNAIIKRYGYTTYLELGVQNKEQNFNKIGPPWVTKIGVDINPAACANFTMTTDEFFAEYDLSQPRNMFDVIFIDASHEFEQVTKDFLNAVRGCFGRVVLHDCNPLKEEYTIVPRPAKTGHWNGNVYKLAAAISNECKYTVDIDNGCCVVIPKMFCRFYDESGIDFFNPSLPITWSEFDSNRRELLNLISWEEFIKI